MAFNGAFLPSTVGMAVVDGDMKEGFKRVFMEKLRAIIGENRLEFMAVGAKVAAKAMKRGGLRKGWEGVHIEAAGCCWVAVVGVDEREDATAVAGRMDGVHLEMSGLGVMARGRRKVVDHVLWGVVAREIGGGGLASVFLVAPVGERSAARIPKFAFVHQAVDGAALGEICVGRSLVKHLQCVGDTSRFSYAFAKSRAKKFETLPRGPLLALRLRVSSTANPGLRSKYSHRFLSGRYHVNRLAVVPFLRMYLTVEGFSPIIRANARTEGLATDFRYMLQYLMHASTSAFPFLRMHDSCVRCLREEMIHGCTPSAPSLCVAQSVLRKADGVFAFGPRRPLGGAPSVGQEDGPRPSSCFALPKARPSFLFLCFGPTSAQLHCGRFV